MITVITVAFNAEQTIRDTIESVLRQKLPVEHWIIDGASKDKTLSICAEYSHLKILSEPDKGLYDAMNKGVRLANGEYVGFLNADDVFAHDAVTMQIQKALQKSDCCFADLVYCDTNLTKALRVWKGTPFYKGAFKYGWAPAHPTFYMKKSKFIEAGGFDLSVKMGTDVVFMLKVLEKMQLKSAYVTSEWIHMRVGGISNQSYKNIWRQNVAIIQAHRQLELPIQPLLFWSKKIWDRILQKFLAFRRKTLQYS